MAISHHSLLHFLMCPGTRPYVSVRHAADTDPSLFFRVDAVSDYRKTLQTRPLLMLLAFCCFAIGEASGQESAGPCVIEAALSPCSIEAVLAENRLVLKSSAPSCSIIEWALDGEPRRSLLLGERLPVEGTETFNRKSDLRKRVSLEACVEVRDTRRVAACDVLKAEFEQINSHARSPSTTSSAASRQAAQLIRRVSDFWQRFMRTAPVGCCIEPFYCSTARGIEQLSPFLR